MCFFSDLAMAGCAKFEYSYNKKVQCHSAIQWSDDFRLAIPSDGGVIVFDLQSSPYQKDQRMVLHQSSVPCPKQCTNVPDISEQLCNEWMDKWTGLSDDEKHEFVIDRTLCPFQKVTVSGTGYRSAKWSPRGADSRGRCVLATLTTDHELCVYENLSGEWEKVADLSQMYRNISGFKINSNMKFQTYKERVYGISAVEICWLNPYNDRTRTLSYSLLAVIMKNRDLVLWKVKCPVRSSSDFTLMKKHNSLGKSTVKCFSVTKHSGESLGLLITGHSDGTLFAHVLQMETGELLHSQTLYSEEDLMFVSCVKCTNLSQDQLLVVATKEQCVLGYVVQFNTGGLHIEAECLVTGPHKLLCTGLSLKKNTSLMCTADGCLIQIVHSYNNKDLKLTLLSCAHTPNEKYLGVDVSYNEVLQAYMTWPSILSMESRVYQYFPLKVTIETVKNDAQMLDKAVEVKLLDETVPVMACLDVLEVFRQNLWNGVNLIPSLTDYIAQKDKWWSLPVKFLQILRYFLITIDLHIPIDADRSTEEELALNESNVLSLGILICIKYIKHSLEIMQTRCQQWNDTEKEIAGSMYGWLNSKQEHVSQLPLQLNRLIDAKVHNCCVCDENLSVDDSGINMKCINGHTFGVCCKTFTPCVITYRVCSVCKSQAQDTEYFSEVPWLESNLCTLCDKLLS